MATPRFESRAWVEGRVVPPASAQVPLLDRGFLFGESVYEVFLAIGGRLFAAAEHWERLGRSGAGIGLDPATFLDRAQSAVEALLPESKGEDALVYLHVTGGAGPREHLPPVPAYRPGIYATISWFDRAALRTQRDTGIGVILYPEDRWAHATWKSTQLLASVRAKSLARTQGAGEVLFVDRDGFLLEGGSTNAFVVLDGFARTPPLSRNILPGVTRRLLLETRPDLVREGEISAAELARATEVFITATTRPVVGVVTIDGRTVGDGIPGPVTRDLERSLDHLMR